MLSSTNNHSAKAGVPASELAFAQVSQGMSTVETLKQGWQVCLRLEYWMHRASSQLWHACLADGAGSTHAVWVG